MACTIIPYDQLGGTKQTGGSWSLLSGGPLTVSVNGGPETTYSDGNAIPGQHNLTLGFNGTAAGTYVLQYTVGVLPCVDTATVTIDVAPSAKAGMDRTLTFCNSNTNGYNLFEFLRNFNGLGSLEPNGTEVIVDTTGAWSGSGTQSGAYSAGNVATPTDDTFTPSLVLFPSGATSQSFTFVYTVTTPGADTNCTNCTDTATINITVTLQPQAGTDGQVTVCNAL
jgi:hypothetical protein